MIRLLQYIITLVSTFIKINCHYHYQQQRYKNTSKIQTKLSSLVVNTMKKSFWLFKTKQRKPSDNKIQIPYDKKCNTIQSPKQPKKQQPQQALNNFHKILLKHIKKSLIKLQQTNKSRKRYFQKMGSQQFVGKLQHIMQHLQKSKCSRSCSCKGGYQMGDRQMFDWLVKLFKLGDVRQQEDQVKQAVFYHIMDIIAKYKQNREGSNCNQWFKSFVNKYRLINYYKKLKHQTQNQAKTQKEPTSKQNNNNNKYIINTKQKYSWHQVKTTIQTNKAQHRNNRKIGTVQENISELQIQSILCRRNGCATPLVDGKCLNGNHLVVLCPKCSWSRHANCQQNTQMSSYKSYFRISQPGQVVEQFELQSIPKLQVQNNIKQIVQKRGYKFQNRQRLLKGTPTNLKCRYPVLKQSSARQLLFNRKSETFLPLQIKQSTIKGAGYGVFATRDIRQNMLICSYLGEIGIGSITPVMRQFQSKNKKNDSVFTLGWLKKQSEIVIIAPNKYSNVGRFINSNGPEKCNLKPSICLLRIRDEQYEIAVILTSTRQIKAGQELYYNYGADYC